MTASLTEVLQQAAQHWSPPMANQTGHHSKTGSGPTIAAVRAAIANTDTQAAYVARLEEAILLGERYVADIRVSARKGYTPRPIYDVADEIRQRRRASA